jgi:hypothetical protein
MLRPAGRFPAPEYAMERENKEKIVTKKSSSDLNHNEVIVSDSEGERS